MRREYSFLFRVMHWSIAITMLFLLLTILLRLGWMNKHHMADIIGDYLKDKDASLSEDELIILAKKIRSPMWDWHIYAGYLLTGLYSIRLLLPFFGEMKFKNPFQKSVSAKVRFEYIVYALFYLFVGVSLVTGLVIEFGPKEYKHTMEEIHELSIYYLLGFIIIHFSGILIAEFTSEKGIISRVIGGNKKS